MKVYNTLTGQKEEVLSQDGEIKMYVCGVTPYSDSHLGHAMSYVIFDVIRRYLQFRGYTVKYVQNITDIDDKIIVLVDDVLYTGRSARAAMDALIDLGRPRAIRLAVLVEKAGRELPIQADYSGYKADVAPGKLVQVNLVESDGKDEVVIE